MFDDSVWEDYYCPGQLSIFDIWPEIQPNAKDISSSGRIKAATIPEEDIEDKEKMKKAKKRIIYSNYNLWDEYEESARDNLEEKNILNPTEGQIWDEIYEINDSYWGEILKRLTKFFSDGLWLLTGTAESHEPVENGGFTFTAFDEMWSRVTKDSDYFIIYDMNGHFYLDCSHYGSYNRYEIKKVTAGGEEYIKKCINKDQRQMHKRLYEHYSSIPNYVHTLYGLPRTEYEEGEPK